MTLNGCSRLTACHTENTTSFGMCDLNITKKDEISSRCISQVVETLTLRRHAGNEATHIKAGIAHTCSPKQNHPDVLSSQILTQTVFGKVTAVHNIAEAVASLAPLHDKSAVGSSSFLGHPAQADAVLHLGAVAIDSKQPTRVPVGLSCLRYNTIAGTIDSNWTTAGATSASNASDDLF